ncbi:hypothetical protein TNCV_2618401 [Trichonephila clavipes]|nr:hypothetical protein TNCV_2618401 [Trichonephila clavipes]
MNCLRVSVLLNGPTASSEEFVAVDDDNVCTATQLWQTKTLWSLFKAQKNILDADFDDENEVNNAAFVPTSSEVRNIMKNMFS